VNVLFIAPLPTHPPIQGSRQRALDVCRAFQRRGARVTVLVWEGELFDAAAIEAMQLVWDDVVVVRRDPAYRQRRSHAAFYALDDWYDPTLTRVVADLARLRRFDVCVTTYVWMSAALEALPEACVRVIDTQDVFGGRAAQFYLRGQAPVWYYTTPSEEERGLDRADLVVAIQQSEAEVLQARTRARVMTVGFLGEAHRLPPRAADGTLVAGFIGSGNPFNVASVLTMVEALRAAPLPAHVRLLAAGPICDVLRRTPGNPFELMGVVAEVEAFYAAIDIALNPMQGGTGLKIKTVEALAFGRAMIGTEAAFEGVATPESHHRCADVAAVMAALHDSAAKPEALARLQEASRATFDAYRDQQAFVFDALNAAILDVAAWRRARIEAREAALSAPPAPAPPADWPVDLPPANWTVLS
jgi:hypothetical protein